MKGYKLEIQHIPGKVNLANYLPRQFVSTAVGRKKQFGMVNKECWNKYKSQMMHLMNKLNQFRRNIFQRDQISSVQNQSLSVLY